MSVTRSWSGGGGIWGVLVHGGAGDLAPDRRALHVEGCRLAAEAAAEVLRGGGRALDAVERAVRVLEDDPNFNAGTGASLTFEGRLELDAALMDGKDLRAGAVCALGPFRNPIAVARAVLEDGQHVLYADSGANAFARAAGFEPLDPDAMITQAARQRLESALASGKPSNWTGGTVGAVAKDRAGSVAAATSTGGIVGKRPGRVGDSPLLGAGTYADDEAGAGSATGYGEGILRVVLTARAVDALRQGANPESAASAAISSLFARIGTRGGLILVDRAGCLGFARSSRTMSWAATWEGGETRGGI